MKVLVTGGGGAGNELIYRLLNNKYDLFFGDACKENINPVIPENKRLEIPLASDSTFVRKIAEICAEKEIKLLIPSVDEELPLMKEIALFCPDIDILVPEHEHLTLMMDKLKLMQYLLTEGLDAPFTTTLDDLNGLDFPFFVKPRWGRGSRGIATLQNDVDLDQYIKNSEYDKKDIIAQQLMTGIEYTVMMSANRNGDLHAVVPVKVDLKKGITIKAVTENNCAVIEACQKIHNLFNTKGCYNIQVFLQPDGTVLPIEINPRISTTFCLGIAAGVEAIDNFYKEGCLNKLSDVSDDWKEGLRLNRHWVNSIY